MNTKGLSRVVIVKRMKLRNTVGEQVVTLTAQKIKFSMKDFFSKCGQIRGKLWIWSHLLKKSFIFCAVFSWDQKIVVDRENRLVRRNFKETIHYVMNPNHINKSQ